MQNHSEIAEFLWKIADLIKDDYDAKDYEDVILPFTLLRRLDCVLLPTRQAVRDAAEKYKSAPEHTRDALLMKAAGQRFYNTSEYSLDELIKRPADIAQNFSVYLAGFSTNVKDILYNFSGGEEKGLSPIYETLLRKRLILKITQAFSEADLSLENVDNHGMGTIFEYLIRKFKEASNEAAGQFYTPRDIIRLMVKLMFEPDRAKLSKESLVGIYDPACGTGGMLTIAKEHLLAGVNPGLEVYLYGQELNEKTYAICKADMLMKGEDPENIKRENTLSHDLLPGKQFNYMLSNPPFGKDWKNIRDEIEADQLAAALDKLATQAPWNDDGRFFAALGKALPWKLTAGQAKVLRAMLSVRDEDAEPVLDGDGHPLPDSELRDCENVPLKEDIDAYFAREVLPHVADAWMDRSKDKIGYEISFTRYFYEYTPLRSTGEIGAELMALDEETENLLREIVRG